jgi:hypothetical protein
MTQVLTFVGESKRQASLLVEKSWINAGVPPLPLQIAGGSGRQPPPALAFEASSFSGSGISKNEQMGVQFGKPGFSGWMDP